MPESIMPEPELTRKQRRELRREEKAAHREDSERRKKWQHFAIWGVALLVLAGIVYGLSQTGGNSGEGNGGGGGLAPVAADEWIKGLVTASTTLIEYSDFQCPACKTYYPLVNQLVREFPTSLRVVYRHFPLPQHQNAVSAAEAAEAAGLQGKFWEMHNLLFDRQRSWEGARDPAETLAAYAKELGLNTTRFENDSKSAAVKNAVKKDGTGGNRAGVNSTPTFFLNGKKITNPQGYEEFKKLIQDTLPK